MKCQARRSPDNAKYSTPALPPRHEMRLSSYLNDPNHSVSVNGKGRETQTLCYPIRKRPSK